MIKILFFSAVAVLTLSCQQDDLFSKRDVRAAQRLTGLQFSRSAIDTMHGYLHRNLTGYDSLRTFHLDRELFPALLFNVLPDDFIRPTDTGEAPAWHIPTDVELPQHLDTLAFFSILDLASLIKHQKITSRELTNLYLDRIRRYNPTLQCVITVTEDLARQQAAQADQEIAAGKYRGPLHGIPYGAKDLMAVAGYPTTWGAQPYRDQVIDYNAGVVEQLEKAGAVLIAKLSSGALARGDVWFAGETKNPWDTLQGASGSSAGSGAATAAGLVAFSLGTETMGSITSPSARNGITGLRPSYGRVSRYGVMTLAWSMDKVGPMCRSARDCALVFGHLVAPDGRDPTIIRAPYQYRPAASHDLRIGLLIKAMDADTSSGAENMHSAVEILKFLTSSWTEKELPSDFPFAAFDIILRAESGAFLMNLCATTKWIRWYSKTSAQGPIRCGNRVLFPPSNICRPTGTGAI